MLTTITGRAKRLVGKVTGNRRLATKGKAQEIKGGTKRKAKHARHRADRAVGRAQGKAKARAKGH